MENAEWVKKLQIEVIDEDDGSATIQIDWDENDPDLQWWTQLGEEGQTLLSLMHCGLPLSATWMTT
jgi:hypothetical protein